MSCVCVVCMVQAYVCYLYICGRKCVYVVCDTCVYVQRVFEVVVLCIVCFELCENVGKMYVYIKMWFAHMCLCAGMGMVYAWLVCVLCLNVYIMYL